jgi:hypothetical protein
VNDNKKQKFVSLSECNHKFWVCYLRIDGENVCKPPFLTGWWLQPLFKKKRFYLVIGKIIIPFLWFEWWVNHQELKPSLRERFPATRVNNDGKQVLLTI